RQDVSVHEAGADARSGVQRAIRAELPTGHLIEFAALEPGAERSGPRKPPTPGTFNIDVNHVQLRSGDVSAAANFLAGIGFLVTDYVRFRDRDGYFAIFTRI